MPLRLEISQQPAVPCSACPTSSECIVWDQPMCYRCAQHWSMVSPTYGEITENYGPDVNAADVYRAFTRKWVAARKAQNTQTAVVAL